MSITIEELQKLSGHAKVVTDHGEKVGSVGGIYLDDVTNAPDWVTVRTGLFGTAETFVPLRAARVEGDDLVVPYARDLIKVAPRIDADGALSPQEEQVLYRHYGVGRTDPALDDEGRREGRSEQLAETAMTRSEERLVVGTQQREAGRARLRKYVVTERVTQTVPVRHEEVRVTREPITNADPSAVPPGLVIREEDYEIVLHAEAPVVEKVVVPVERVRLDTVTVAGNERVSADVRREEIELDDSTDNSKPSSTRGPAAPDASQTQSSPGTAKTKPKGKKGTRRRR